MSLATLARKTKAKQRLRTRGNFILNMTARGNVLGMNAKMSRGNCKGLTKCAGKRAACCVGVGPQDNCNKMVVPTTQPDMTMVQGSGLTGYGYDGVEGYGSLIPPTNILNINTTDTNQVNRGSLLYDDDFGPGSNGGLIYEIGIAGGPVATFNTITFVADNGTSISYSYGSGIVTGAGITWNNSTAQYNFWNPLPNGTTIQIFIDNTNPNVGPPYFSDPCCCQFKHGGKPAPQMGYRVYLNRKSKGAYRPAGGKQCKTLDGCTNAKTVWKQGNNLDASVITTNRRDNILACNSNVYTAPTDCSKRCCCDCKSICGCRSTDVLRYTRINKSFGCQTTKAVRMGRSASEQIARRRAAVDCIKPTHRTIHLSAGQSTLSFDGCCGNQCLIPGQQYTVDTGTLTLSIEWCTGLTRVLADKNWTIGETFTTSLTVPQFASLPCHPATVATIKTSNGAQVGLGIEWSTGRLRLL